MTIDTITTGDLSRYELSITPDEVQLVCRCGDLVWQSKGLGVFRKEALTDVAECIEQHEYDVRHPFEPGTRVEVSDAAHDPATVVSHDLRGDEDGYVVRYDSGCEVWVREYDVRAL